MADTIKISDLGELLSGSIKDSSVIPIVDGGTTQKVKVPSLKAYLTDGFATDGELTSAISALTTTDISEGTRLYYTDARVKTKLNAESVLSGSITTESIDNFETEVSRSAAAAGFGTGGGGGGVTSYLELTNIPSGIISSSAQIEAVGGIVNDNTSSMYVYSASLASVAGYSLTASYALNAEAGVTSYTDLTNIPGGIISQSSQLDRDLLNFFGGDAHVTITSSSVFGPLAITISVDTGSGAGGGSTDYISNVAYADGEIVFTGVGSAFNSSIALLDFISSSQQISDFGFITTTNGLISGAAQIAELGAGIVSGSITLETVLAAGSSSDATPQLGGLIIGGGSNYSFPTSDGSAGQYLGTDGNGTLTFSTPAGGGSNDWTTITNKPNGLVSASEQIVLADTSHVGFLTSMVTEDTSSGDYRFYSNTLVKSYLDSLEVVSGGLSPGAGTPAEGTLSSSTQVDYDLLLNKPDFIGGDSIAITSASGYVQIDYSPAGGTLDAQFYSFTQSYELDKATFITGSSQIIALGFDPNAGDVSFLNAWTGSGGEFGAISQSINNRIDSVEALAIAGVPLGTISGSSQVDYSLIQNKVTITAGPGITIAQAGNDFAVSSSAGNPDWTNIQNIPNGLISSSTQISEFGYATTGNITTEISSYSSSQESTFNTLRGDITSLQSYNTTNEGGYALTGSGNTFIGGQYFVTSIISENTIVTSELQYSSSDATDRFINVTGSFRVSGSVTADEFIVGSAGTPSITSATDIEMSASADINMIAQTINVTGDLLPSSNELYDLGSPTKRWKDLYLSGSTIDLGGTLITRNANGNIEFLDSGSLTQKSLNIAAITGSVYVSQTVTVGEAMKLQNQSSLPAGSTGMLAVSGSELWFYGVSGWGKVSVS